MDYFEHRRRLDAVKSAEATGKVADSMEVRAALIAKLDTGEMTLDQVQAELKKIKRNASRNGMTTRNAIFRGRG